MADYTVSTNLISWIPAMHGVFGWPRNGAEADLIQNMNIGDYVVPKFAQNPVHGEQEAYQQAIAIAHDDDWTEQKQAYEEKIAAGAGAVPFVMRVDKQLGDLDNYPSAEPWASVAVSIEWLDHPLTTSDFLRLRVVPVQVARQFKAMAAPNNHIQVLPAGAAKTILAAGKDPAKRLDFFRCESLVKATDATEAAELLADAGLDPEPLDRAFLVSQDAISGLHICEEDGALKSTGEPIAMAPAELKPLLTDAKAKAVKSDSFKPARAIAGADELVEFLSGGETVRRIDEFFNFHDRYVILPRKVTEAIEISSHPTEAQGSGNEEPGEEGEPADVPALDELLGLSVEAVKAQLPDGMVLPDTVLAEAVTALRSGKHLLFSGPPGTGKSTVAAAVCRAVVGTHYQVATATADWTTFDTIGGYIPRDAGGGLGFEPGLVLRCLKTSEWLLIDEMNRADIDKAFGPLFTLLAGSGQSQETVLLPYRHDGKNITIGWGEGPADGSADYAVTKVWRLLGTMNVSDKASLFQLSFAFLRRFAVVDVPLPDPDQYRDLFEAKIQDLPSPAREQIADAAMAAAFGPVELGPAILLDIASFTRRGQTKTSSGLAPYSDPVEAFLTAIRLYAVPQYEGASDKEVGDLTDLLKTQIPNPPESSWQALLSALDAVSLQ